MRRPGGKRPIACVAAIALAALSGCGVRLVDGASRSSGFVGGSYLPRGAAGSRDDVPVHGHRIHVVSAYDGLVSGELIAAGGTDLVIETDARERVRIPLADVRSIVIDLAPSHAGTTALMSLGAMGAGVAGLATLNESNAVTVFFAGWGLVWLPLGLIVALPTAGIVAASGDGRLESQSVGLPRMLAELYQFARYPQGEPSRAPRPAPSITPPGPPPAPPPPPALQTPEEPGEETEPTVVPDEPERPPPAPPRSTN
jgi:hypothetical protein